MPAIELPLLRVDLIATIIASTRPLLSNRDPSPGEDAVPIDSALTIHIVDPGEAGINRASARVWIDGLPAFNGGESPEHLPGFDGPRAASLLDPDTLYIRLDPLQPFASEATVSVRVLALTSDGHALDETYSFQVEDRTAPKVTSAQATGPKTLRIGFDEPVLAPPDAAFLFTPMDAPAIPLSATAANTEGNVLTLTLSAEMSPDARYRLTIEGVTDLAGNPVMAPSDQVIFTGFRPSQPINRHFKLWEMLPKHNRRADLTGDLRRFIACLQEITDLLLAGIDRFPDIFDLERAPAPFLDLILQDLGDPFSFELNTLDKRRLASVLVEMYRQKGTAIGIINAVRFFLGVEVLTVMPYAGEAMILGESLLGEDWALGPSSRFARYAFDVEVGVHLGDVQREQLRVIVEYLKPAHTHFVTLVEPAPPAFIDHWELGVSEVGVTTDLH